MALSDLGYHLRGAVFTYQNALSDYKYCKLIDPTCEDGFSIEPYRTCELFIGMHFHSIVLALQNHIPVIAISYSDKVRRLMEEYQLEAYCIQPEDAELPHRLVCLAKTLSEPAVMADVVDKIRQGNEAARQRLVHFERELRRVIS